MTTTEVTKRCCVCGAERTITVPKQEYFLWAEGQGNIQNMMPGVSEDDREMLISETCPDCWDEIFQNEDE